MAQPDVILNTRAQSVDVLIAPDGTPLLKLAVGIKNVGLTPDAGWQGVATHQDGDTFAASDGVVAIGGVDDGSVVRKALADADGRLSIRALPTSGLVYDFSGTITAGGVSQTMIPTNADRRYLFIQNTDPAEDMWINFGVDATVGQPSIKLIAGAAFDMERSFISIQEVRVVAATIDHPFTAKEGEAA